MERRTNSYGEYICCPQYPGCDFMVYCHVDGRAMGTPANSETRAYRRAAHASFDQLWYSHIPGFRKREYAWLAEQMGLTKDECHIGMFDIDQCKQAIELVSARLESGTTTTNGVYTDGRARITDR